MVNSVPSTPSAPPVSNVYLSNVRITFHTHNDNLDHDTVLHVFVKNRTNTSSDPESNTDFIGNLKAYQRFAALGDNELNPYLAFGKALSQGIEFEDPSSHTFDLTLRSNKIKSEDIILPVVNIHILPNGNDRWIFHYTINFTFDNGNTFSFSSNINGVKGIILDQDNRDYSGICIENKFRTIISDKKPDTEAVLTKVKLEFVTHNDNKDFDTRLNVHITNRSNANSNTDLVIGLDLLKNTEFKDPSYKSFSWSSAENNLASNSIKLKDIVLPVVNIIIIPNRNDRWIFDYIVTFEFTDTQTDGGRKIHTYSSRTNGIILDQDNNKYSGVYQGNSFPRVSPATAPELANSPILQTKVISLSFLQRKLDDFVNNRQGSITSHNPPMVKVRFHNSGFYVDGNLPESYLDIQSINAIKGGVEYISAPSSLGQLTGIAGVGDLYLNDINSKTITLNIDKSSPTPFTLKIDFETDGPNETIGGVGGMNFTEFYIAIKLTLHFDAINHKIDLMSWVDDIEKTSGDDERDALIAKYIDVQLHTDNETWDPDGIFKGDMATKFYGKLSTKDIITGRTKRDDINSTINSLLLGGVIDDVVKGVANPNNNVLHSAQIVGDNLMLNYSGPKNIFKPQIPQDWPNASTNPDSIYDFSPGNLTNIDHIVVLTMENRSFDHILGYLSLPVNKGGMGRKDVDGLKGGEFNPYNGNNYPSFPLADTYFAPDPTHSYEPVHRAINDGKMDGFVKSFAEEHGNAIAGNIMGYHTGANVPVYDALARDFAISHRWFAAHPGPTFCNRFYELTGRLNLDSKGFWEFGNSHPIRPVFTKTIFDYLNEYAHIADGLTWNYFEHHYCFLRFFEQYTFDDKNIIDAEDPLNGFYVKAKNGTLPSVSFIDPHFIEMPPDANCDGPVADVKDGQALVQKIVEAVVASPNWNKTLLIITYDEHGGFFDHLPPPRATKVSFESPINTYGIRVPAFFISPWVKQGEVFGNDHSAQGVLPVKDSLYFDHTSILKTIARRFMTDYPPYMGARYAAAKDLTQVVGTTLRQTQFLPFIRYHMVYNASLKSLDVKGANKSPGTLLWQFNVNNTEAQNFSFEDAGGGYFYIRTHCGNMYVTVDVPKPILTAGGSPAPPLTHNIKQDVKYAGGGFIPNLQTNPDYQKWKLTQASHLINNLFVISNAFFPDKVLQPINNTDSGVAVVIGDKAPGTINNTKNAWKITSPLINQTIFTQ